MTMLVLGAVVGQFLLAASAAAVDRRLAMVTCNAGQYLVFNESCAPDFTTAAAATSTQNFTTSANATSMPDFTTATAATTTMLPATPMVRRPRIACLCAVKVACSDA